MASNIKINEAGESKMTIRKREDSASYDHHSLHKKEGQSEIRKGKNKPQPAKAKRNLRKDNTSPAQDQTNGRNS